MMCVSTKKIILASASPRRKELLKSLNLDFEAIHSEVEENLEEEAFSSDLIKKLALEKAMDVKKKVNFPAIIIGADTVVIIDNKVFGKPRNSEDAFRMLKNLNGRTHKVMSAIALVDNQSGKVLVDLVESKVTFKELTDKEIKDYIATGEPMDKAGAYAIQGLGSIFIKSICGCYTNIVGLSVYKLAEMLKEFGISIIGAG